MGIYVNGIFLMLNELDYPTASELAENSNS